MIIDIICCWIIFRIAPRVFFIRPLVYAYIVNFVLRRENHSRWVYSLPIRCFMPRKNKGSGSGYEEREPRNKTKKTEHTWYPQIQNYRHRFFRYQPLSNTTSSRTLIRSNSRGVKTCSLLSVNLPIYKSILAVIWIRPVFEPWLIDWDESGEW